MDFTASTAPGAADVAAPVETPASALGEASGNLTVA